MSSQSLPFTYKAAVVTGANEPLQIKQVPMPVVREGELLIKVHACGVCHSDHNILSGKMGPPKISQLGHEYIGTIAGLPANETKWKLGDLVGGAWHGGHDSSCRACARGQFQLCTHRAINGCTREGGYGEYTTLRREAAVRIPCGSDPASTAPLLCAGVTVFNGMRRMGVQAGETVAVQGLGGLGHLAIQYAAKMGFRVVALSRGEEKRGLALELGAHEYIDTAATAVGPALQALGGGAALIVVTAPDAAFITPLLAGLASGGKLLVHTAIGPVLIDTGLLVRNALSVCGWPSGHALDSEEAIAFARRTGVECMVEKFPLDRAQEAMEYMLSGKARFRAVLTMD